MALALYIGGAIGVELIGGCYCELYGEVNLTYCMIIIVEECIEMAGVIVFIWVQLVYIADSYKELQFPFDVFRGDVMLPIPSRSVDTS